MEALGGAASVIGVASLAIQICKELQKVYEFWSSVKEAPEDIARISTEVKLFMTLLTVIANNYQRQGFDHRNPSHVVATDTLGVCLATVQEMNDGVKDLEGRLSTGRLSRRWASMKFVFRKDKREKVERQVERMKSLLLIVQTCYNGEMQEAGFRSLSMSLRLRDSALQATSGGQFLDMTGAATTSGKLMVGSQQLQPMAELSGEMVNFDPKATQQARRRPTYSTRQQQERTYNFGLAMLRFISTKQERLLTDESGNERRVPAQQNRYDLRITQWLLSRGFSWESFGTYSNWQYSFRTFRYVPEDSLIAEFCEAGDIANVQKMFDKGLASPFDRVALGSDDWSLLHYSVFNHQAQMCRFLIECGLGRGSVSGISDYPILFFFKDLEDDLTAHLDTIKILVNEGQYDLMMESGDIIAMHLFNGSPEAFQWLLKQEEFLIDVDQKLNGSTIASCLLAQQASRCLEMLITHERGLIDSPVSCSAVGLTLIQQAVWRFGNSRRDSDFIRCIKVLRDAGVDFHALSYCGTGTLLEDIFSSAVQQTLNSQRYEYKRCEYDQGSIPTPPMMSAKVLEYDRLEDISAIDNRPRTSKSLWYTWYPGHWLSILEIVQRYLDAWMEVLLEAGLDIAEYGRREDQLHPEGLLDGSHGMHAFISNTESTSTAAEFMLPKYGCVILILIPTSR